MNYLFYLGLNFLSIMIMILVLLLGVAFLTLLERKMLGYVQNRKGPNKLGIIGLLQPFSDAIKLYSKELFVIFKSNKYLYYLCPLMSFMMMMMIWLIFPYITNLYSMNYSLLVMILIMSISGYVLLLMGWSSNSIYSMLGALRSVSQALSYEVSFIFIVMILMLLSESYSLVDLNKWQIYMNNLVFMFPVFLMFFLSVLAELNRTPMDFVEGESELVSGFNIEYFSGSFALIFMGEYGMIIFFSMLMSVMFMKILFIFIMFIYINVFIVMIIMMRGLLPRMRYDELMYLCWKIILPLVLSYFLMFMVFKVLFMMIL
uniref:NADH-ubiquinone oxidoreductase chain 1 n=1 Tax=Dolichoderus sibiricus TaxID=609446 RepID=A0A3R5URC5_9HYME|nr:NADH dehydrogenase subunit 1 [Dolichoderus sibiricus]QAA79733.1 NADH dehydrogenase subunit 1 [Dolichoderus sibiricus]UEC47353.1 NADH dehydrogenase subunit 1 [Dolichoderus sibiricus]